MTAACQCVGHYTECHTQKKNTLHVKPVMLVCIQNPPQQEPTSCGRLLFPEWGGICRVLDFNEVLIQLLNHQNYTAICSLRTRSQVMFALLCHGRLAQYCCIWFAPRIFVFVFSSVIVLVFVRFACYNFYFYIVFVFTRATLCQRGLQRSQLLTPSFLSLVFNNINAVLLRYLLSLQASCTHPCVLTSAV